MLGMWWEDEKRGDCGSFVVSYFGHLHLLNVCHVCVVWNVPMYGLLSMPGLLLII